MQRHSLRIAFVATLFFTAACAQNPAPIEFLGQNTYGPDGAVYSGNAQSAATHVAGYTTGGVSVVASAAPNSPISSNDLAPPPAKIASNTAPALQRATTPSHAEAIGVSGPKPLLQASDSNPINPWTGRPHFTEASAAPAPAPVVKKKGVAWPDRVAETSRKHTPEAKIADNSSLLMWPVDSHHIISTFGPKGHGLVNDGINIAADDGEPVWASGGGEVVYVGNGLAGYGNMILIKHPGNKTTAYAHLSRITVDKYQRVKQGDIIGYVGSTGNVRTPQLHFAVREGNRPVDPKKYLATNVAGL